MIDYDFQGFVNNKYIIKAKEKLIELSKTAETQIQNTKPHRKPKRKIRYRFNI